MKQNDSSILGTPQVDATKAGHFNVILMCQVINSHHYCHKKTSLADDPFSHVIYYIMRTSLTCNALILSGGRGYRPDRHLRRYSTCAPSPDTCPPVTNPHQGRRMRQLLLGRGRCTRGQMSASVRLSVTSTAAAAVAEVMVAVSLSVVAQLHLTAC